MADKTDVRHGMALGADDYLIKPFTTDELLVAAIATRFAKHEALMPQYNLKILQEACTNEIALLNQMPTLQNILTAEDVNILHQFGIVKLTI